MKRSASMFVLAVVLTLVRTTAAAFGQSDPEMVGRGVVVDSAMGLPIKGVMVKSLIKKSATRTRKNGSFTIAIAAKDSLLVSAVGYAIKWVGVSAGDTALIISLSRLPVSLTGVVITASRRAQQSGETPVPVTVATLDDIESRGATSVDRVLDQMGGLQVQPNAPTGANLAIRGMDGAKVLVLLDGEPIAGNLLENRDLSRLSTLAVDRIEVVKGPLSALYGSDAIGGVVNVITKAPAGPLTVEAQGRMGGYGRRETELTVGRGGGLSFRATGGVREQGAVASVGSDNQALSRVWDFRTTGRLAISSQMALRADLSLLRERQRWLLSSDGFNGFNDNRAVLGWLEGLHYTGESGIRARLYLEDYRHLFRQAREDKPLTSDTTPSQLERMVKGSLIWTRPLANHVFDVGVEGSIRRIESPGKLHDDASDRMAELYLQDAWAYRRLMVQPAARLTANSRWGNTLTPSLSASAEVTRSFRVRTGVGRGFRGPSFKELGWDFPNAIAGYTIQGNPDLTPERSLQASVGGAYRAAGWLDLDAEIYRNGVKDLIELIEVGIDSASGLRLFSPRNVARARTAGIDLTVRARHARWSGMASYSRLWAKDLETGEPLDRRPPHSGKLQVGRDFGRESRVKADLSLGYTAAAPTVSVDGVIGEQEALLDASTEIRVRVSRAITLSAGADNLFDAAPAGWTGLLGRRGHVGVKTSLLPR